MEFINLGWILLASYLIGSVPFGLLIIKLSTGQDIRQVESGRTGGTNAMRAGGVWAGFVTAILDVCKAAATVWLARRFAPGNIWLEIFSPLLAILGHNYSLFLIERTETGKLRIRGGAGGATCVGGSTGLWFPSLFIMAPAAAFILYFIGYASIATLSIAVCSILVFGVRAALGFGPWQHILFGVFSLILLIWSLRGNIRRLLKGTERLVGRRAQKRRLSSNGEK